MKPFALFSLFLLVIALLASGCEKRTARSPESVSNAQGTASTHSIRKIQTELDALTERENSLRDEVRKLTQTIQGTQASLNESLRSIDRDLGAIEQQRKNLEAAVRQADLAQAHNSPAKRRNWPWPFRVALALVVAGAMVLLYRRLVLEQGNENAWVEDGHIEENELGSIHYPDRNLDPEEPEEEGEPSPDETNRDRF
jgi:TolA-binding protein